MKKNASISEKRKKDKGIPAHLGTVAHTRWMLVFYDFCVFLFAVLLLLILHPSVNDELPRSTILKQSALCFVCIFGSRFGSGIYRQIWRYGNLNAFLRLLVADGLGGIVYAVAERFLRTDRISFIRALSLVCVDLIGVFATRMLYHVLYLRLSRKQSPLRKLLRLLTGVDIKPNEPELNENPIRIAIVGAGHTGVGLAEELRNNPSANYLPVCFIDCDAEKVGRSLLELPVLHDSEVDVALLSKFGVQEIVFAVPQLSAEERKHLFEHYKITGRKIKVYDYPVMNADEGGKRHLRDFDIEELLFRKPIQVQDSASYGYYGNQVVLVTGGGGSIGSELCRQIAKMKPKKLVILDVYENGAYDIQQELRIAYGDKLALCVEIVSVCNREGVERVFREHRPDIVLHAAAHKHVPFMERNCCEAVQNNVFGTLNVVELAEKYHAKRFIMISTDKAVNPTNVMGATKRMCEMIVLSRSRSGSGTVYSATRFGNVLGSAGSVIPLFRRQIAHGGPVTVTDKRIIRYFMTIPEAAQLVLQSGVMAKNGELFVLDMGKPVHIWELAENMIRLSGFEVGKDIEIIETGLRPGEKLYEELLIQSEDLKKTENDLIFIERDHPLEWEAVLEKLQLLETAAESGSDDAVRSALHQAVPTFCEAKEHLEKTLAQASAGQ